MLHQLKVDNDQVSMVIQIDPEIVLQDLVNKIKNTTEKVLKREFDELKKSSIWESGFWAETMDRYEL